MGDMKGDTMSPIPAALPNSMGDTMTSHTSLHEREERKVGGWRRSLAPRFAG